MKSNKDHAPALTRGIALIRQLGKEGQGTLEQLASRGGWPKSSTLRYLQALESSGIARQDPSNKVWHLIEKLTPFESKPNDPLSAWRNRLSDLVQKSGHCAELYSVSEKAVTLEDRADPVINEMQLSANIGYHRELSELDSIGLCYFAFSGATLEKDDGSWHWSDGEHTTVRIKFRKEAIATTQREGIARDYDFNINGVRRFAVPVLKDNELIGILAVAQRQTPRAQKETEIIHQALLGLTSAVTRVAQEKLRRTPIQ